MAAGGKRNAYLAAAITLIALTFVFAPGEQGMLWLMWRDAPWLAIALVATAGWLMRLWWRTRN